MSNALDTGQIRTWRSIVTLLTFVITNIIVLFPFYLPVYIPRPIWNALRDGLSSLRIISPRQGPLQHARPGGHGWAGRFVRLDFPLNFITAPLIADLFLLAILAIGRQEVHDGTLGANNISPLDIMIFFLTLAYIAISIDASGLIRYLAFKVLQWGGRVGGRLFLALYAFFFGLGSFIGNDPIILSGTAFLAYMTRVASNIRHPRAWIHTQFAVANIASAILVSSNPTNLVLAGAFQIKFITYTANMIVPVIVTGIVLFPFLLYFVFADPFLIPHSIEMHELPQEAKDRKPVNPNIPHARGTAEEEELNTAGDEVGKRLSLEEIMNPFLDKKGAAFGAVVMATTLITLLTLNAVNTSSHEHPVFWVTLPAAFVMFCWDIGFGWLHRDETREIARKGRQEVEEARLKREREAGSGTQGHRQPDGIITGETPRALTESPVQVELTSRESGGSTSIENTNSRPSTNAMSITDEKPGPATINQTDRPQDMLGATTSSVEIEMDEKRKEVDPEKGSPGQDSEKPPPSKRERHTLVSIIAERYRWSQETFPTVTAVLAHLPFALVPFALCMFVLVQGLVTAGWVPVFAYGWDHWVTKTGTVGAIGGMGFLSVILCNFAGTNIGTTILLSRVIQAWQEIHSNNGIPISDRTFWATVYSMALGVNYGAFSTAFSASLAGLLWRDILARKHIRVRRLEFARVNLPIIAIAMTIGCAVLTGEMFIVRGTDPYKGGGR